MVPALLVRSYSIRLSRRSLVSLILLRVLGTDRRQPSPNVRKQSPWDNLPRGSNLHSASLDLRALIRIEPGKSRLILVRAIPLLVDCLSAGRGPCSSRV